MPTIHADEFTDLEGEAYHIPDPEELESCRVAERWNTECHQILLKKVFGERFDEVMGKR
jgi:hypothetical protein